MVLFDFKQGVLPPKCEPFYKISPKFANQGNPLLKLQGFYFKYHNVVVIRLYICCVKRSHF